MGTVSLNGIRFKAPATWQWWPFNGLILGRPDSRVGIMQLLLSHRNKVLHSADRDSCDLIARSLFGIGDGCESAHIELDDAQFGEFVVRDGQNLNFMWYQVRNKELILGTFGVRPLDESTPEIETAQQIIQSATYFDS